MVRWYAGNHRDIGVNLSLHKHHMGLQIITSVSSGFASCHTEVIRRTEHNNNYYNYFYNSEIFLLFLNLK